MSVPVEPAAAIGRREVLVDGDWLEAHLGDGGVVVVEVDERPVIYRNGHIPGAHCLDWRRDLQDQVRRDVPDAAAVGALWDRLGISESTVVVLYGDKSNWYACFGFWLFRMYGLRHLRLLDGGRQTWVTEGRPLTDAIPPDRGVSGALGLAPESGLSAALRATWRTTLEAVESGGQLLDVRTPAEFSGAVMTEPGYPLEGAQRPGHIPGAVNVPWDVMVGADGRILPDDALRARLTEYGIDLQAPMITYCRIGERSAHTWFVLSELLGARAANYDGSWTEWGSMIGMPVAVAPAVPLRS